MRATCFSVIIAAHAFGAALPTPPPIFFLRFCHHAYAMLLIFHFFHIIDSSFTPFFIATADAGSPLPMLPPRHAAPLMLPA